MEASMTTNNVPTNRAHAREKVFHSDGAAAPRVISVEQGIDAVRDVNARLKKMSSTDDGKLQIVLEAELVQFEVMMKIRDLFLIQQGRVCVDFLPDLSVE
jgi:hypothetical protein